MGKNTQDEDWWDLTIGDSDDVRKTLKEERIFRRSGYSHVLRSNPDQALEVLSNIANHGYDTTTRRIARESGFISLKSGGRIMNTLGFKKRDFWRTGEAGGELRFFNDKGGLTRTVEVDDELISFLEKKAEGMAPDDSFFEDRKKDGQLKYREQLRQGVSKIIEQAAEEFNATKTITEKDKDGNEIEKNIEVNFTTHSLRKAFALKRIRDYYLMMSSRKKMEELLEQKFEENPKIEEKYFTQLNRINSKRNKNRDMTREEAAIFLTSTDLGHFRTDVINIYYCNFIDVKSYYRI